MAGPAAAIDFPPLSGRVVDQANLLSPAQEAELTQKLEALQRASSRQLVVATVASLQDQPIEDYGYQLGRAWRIGQQGANNGIILLVAPNEKRVRIEVGYGLEPIMTDGLANQIIQQQILPHFRNNNDYAGGIMAGADAIIAQLQAPLEQAEQTAAAAERARSESGGARGGARRGSSSPWPLIFWIGVTLFIVFGLTRSGMRGKAWRRRRRGWGGPIVIWGPGWGGGHRDDWGGGGGWGGGSWGGGGGGSWGGGGGGFSGGGGSFGGGGASGGW